LNLKCVLLVSKFAFKWVNLYRYTKVEFKTAADGAGACGDGEVLRAALEALVGVHGALGEDDAAAACRQHLAGL
jgi:hypothetical protein